MAPSVLVNTQQIAYYMGGNDWLFLEVDSYKTLYTFVQSQKALSFADSFVQPVVGLAMNDATQ